MEQAEDIANEDQLENDSDNQAYELNKDKQGENSVNPEAELDENKKTTTEVEPQPPIENALVKENNEEESEEKKINLKIKVRLIGLAGKEFSFDQVFPFGANLDFAYVDKETNTEQRITKKFTSKENEIDFSNFYPEEIKNGRLELKTNGSNLLLVDQNKDLSSYSHNEEFAYEIYQLPNTKLKFKTYDTEGKQVANPKFGKFTYRLKDKIIENLDIGRDDSKALIEEWNLDNWKVDENPLAEVSLETGENSYIEDENFTYEIIKGNHKDNDFTKPFEVSLLRKPKIIESKNKNLDSNDKTLNQEILHEQAENSKENKDNILDLRSQILREKDKINSKSSQAKSSPLEIKEKNKDGLQISPPLEENRQMANQEEKPGFMETRVVVRVKLHPLAGKSVFYFDKAFSDGTQVVLEGECIDCRYDDIENGKIVTKTFNDDFLESKTLENKIEQEIDFGIKSQLYFGTNNDEYEDDDRYIEAYYDPYSDRLRSVYSTLGIDWSKGYPTTILGLDIYQSHNTEIIVKTIDENKNIVANPNGSLTHTIGSENRKIAIPSDSKVIDPFDGLRIGGGNYDNFNGSKESKVSLDGADSNGFLVDGEFAYKIIKQEQRNKVEPLEVTIQKKPLVRTTNPNNSDYVKVSFQANDHSTITGENPTYWVLKGLDLGNAIKAPKVVGEDGYGFINWSPFLKENNQVYESDTVHKAKTRKISYFDFITYSGDTITNGLTFTDGSGLNYIALVEEYGQYKLEDYKDKIDLEETSDIVSISLPEGVIHKPYKGKFTAQFQMKVDNSFGDKILASANQELVREGVLFAGDIYNNYSWWKLRYTIKTQNTKGIVSPEEVSTSKDVKLSKDEIIEGVRKGTYSYNDEVPEKNKSGENALDIEVDGKNILNPQKVKSFTITDQDYEKIDFSKTGQQEVPVTITYLDNSTSLVNVKINISENVPTGLSDYGYSTSSILLLCGILLTFLSLVNYRKNRFI